MKTKEVTVLNEEDFLTLEKEILKMSYVEITPNDRIKTFLRLNITPPRRIISREASYRYSNNGYTVILHTSYLKKDGKWRDVGTDIGWNLITEGDQALYFARPFERTKGFILKFLRYAWISKWKVDNRPLCPSCKAYMHIHRKYKTRQYFWACGKMKDHIDSGMEFLPWDYKLPPLALRFIGLRRENTKRYQAKIKKEGKTVVPAAKIRKPWKIGNPENLV